MKGMQRRVKVLKAGRSKDLSPAPKKWLGLSLIDEEQLALDGRHRYRLRQKRLFAGDEGMPGYRLTSRMDALEKRNPH